MRVLIGAWMLLGTFFFFRHSLRNRFKGCVILNKARLENKAVLLVVIFRFFTIILFHGGIMNIFIFPLMFLLSVLRPGKKVSKPMHSLSRLCESAIPFLKKNLAFNDEQIGTEHLLLRAPIPRDECHLFQIGQKLTWRKDDLYVFFACRRSYGMGPFQVLGIVPTGKKLLVSQRRKEKKRTLRSRIGWAKTMLSKGVTIFNFFPSVAEVSRYILEDTKNGTILVVPPSFLTGIPSKKQP